MEFFRGALTTWCWFMILFFPAFSIQFMYLALQPDGAILFVIWYRVLGIAFGLAILMSVLALPVGGALAWVLGKSLVGVGRAGVHVVCFAGLGFLVAQPFAAMALALMSPFGLWSESLLFSFATLPYAIATAWAAVKGWRFTVRIALREDADRALAEARRSEPAG